jgi:hypothetical protein
MNYGLNYGIWKYNKIKLYIIIFPNLTALYKRKRVKNKLLQLRRFVLIKLQNLQVILNTSINFFFNIYTYNNLKKTISNQGCICFCI